MQAEHPGAGLPSDGRSRPPRPVPPSVWALPDPVDTGPDGLVGFGADLEPATLVDAYRRGIFPWPHPDVALPWFSPDPRGVITWAGVRVSRSLTRTLRQRDWTTTIDHDTAGVMDGCAARTDEEGTWITPALREAFLRLARLGWVHSVEVWEDGRLVGGLYGVQVGAVFTGESMFHRASDASKVALLELLWRFHQAGGQLVDVQLLTPHLASLGAVEVPRGEYLARLQRLRDLPVRLPLERRPLRVLAEAVSARPVRPA